MRKWLSFLLPFIGLGIFVFIVKGTGMGRIIDTFKLIDPVKLFLIPFFIVFIIVIRGYRWQYLMRMVGIDYSLRRSAVVWTIGFFAAAITPGKVGDALRAFYVSDETGKNFGESFLTVFIDRLLDLVVVLLMGVVTTIIFSYYYMKIPSIWVVFLGILGIFVLLFLMLHRGLMKKLLKPVFNALVPKKYRDGMSLSFNSFYDSLREYVRKWKGTLNAFLLTVVYWVVIFILAYYIAYMMDVKVSFAYLFIIMPMVTLVELIPISISGLGTREATVIFFFSIIGISSAKAVGFSIAYLLIGTYLTSLLGFFLWFKNPAKFSR
jgi:uncharacterized protein (TIRG00374 family)